MSLSVQTEDRGAVSILKLTGKLALGRDSQQVENTVTQMLNEGKTNLVIDLDGVDYIDSTGVGIVSFCFGKVKDRGQLRVSGAKGHVREVFRMTLLDTLVPFHETVEEAVASFA